MIAQRFTELVKKSKSYRYRVDLTRRRLNLLHKAREMAKGITAVEFTFSDVNCRLAFRLNTGDFKFFNSEIEVANIIANLQTCVRMAMLLGYNVTQ